jgi:hypothetical protein
MVRAPRGAASMPVVERSITLILDLAATVDGIALPAGSYPGMETKSSLYLDGMSYHLPARYWIIAPHQHHFGVTIDATRSLGTTVRLSFG